MNKEQLETIIDDYGRELPERLTGNEENAIITERLAKLVQTHRPVVVDLLRDWIGIRIPESLRRSEDPKREGSMWLALYIAERYSLDELRSDIEALLADVKAGKTYLPYYADTIGKFLCGLSSQHDN